MPVVVDKYELWLDPTVQDVVSVHTYIDGCGRGVCVCATASSERFLAPKLALPRSCLPKRIVDLRLNQSIDGISTGTDAHSDSVVALATERITPPNRSVSAK